MPPPTLNSEEPPILQCWLPRSATVGSPSGSPGRSVVSLGAYTERFCSMKDAICQVRSRHIQRRIVPSDTRRDPGPRRVDHRGCQSVCVRGLIYKYAVNLSG